MNTRYQSTSGQTSVRHHIETRFIPFATQTERFFKRLLFCLFVALLLSQTFIRLFPEHIELVNKATQYEGVFREDQVETRATLQGR